MSSQITNQKRILGLRSLIFDCEEMDVNLDVLRNFKGQLQELELEEGKIKYYQKLIRIRAV